MSKLTTSCLLFVLEVGLVFGQTQPTPAPSRPAQTPPSTAAPASPSASTASPGQQKAAAELVDIMNLKTTFNEGKEAMIKAQVQSNPAMAQFEDLMRQFMEKYLSWDQVKDQFVGIYAEMFTEPELRELIQLYNTPTGKKLLTSMPEIMNRSMQITQKQLQPHLPELQQQIMARMQEQQKQQQPPAGQAQPGQQGQPSVQPGQGTQGQGQTQPGQPKPQTPPPSQEQPKPSTPPK
jgi:hypothetical protein